ncbi:polyprenyl synthetase family protein [Streptomyces sp. NPDC060002]|uniref:polyprenyl synthetase family protein n=1 Tax=Streptomyces sp. NPDC060002 TaxID=3347033 RepID=UPI0036818778
MTSVSAPPADTGSIQQTRTGMLALVEHRLRHLRAQQEAHRFDDTGPRAAQPAEDLAALVADGGTRLRPVFCVSGFLAAGGNPKDPVAVDTCAALGLLHQHPCARLHDDNTSAAEDVALFGDHARAYADRLATRLPAAARTVWNDLRTEPATGPHPDNAAAATAEDVAGSAPFGHRAVPGPGRGTLHRPLVLGALLAGRPELAPAFESYGLALGEACRLRDDLIDVFGPTQDTDRPTGPGPARHRTTLLLALAAERSPHAGALLARNGHADAALLRRLLDESGTKATAERRIAGLVDKACAALATPALGRPWRQEFSRLATRLAYRGD